MTAVNASSLAVPPATGRDGLLGKLRHDPLLLSLFFSLLLLGGDRLSINLAGLNFRLVFPVLMVTVGLLCLKLGRKIAFDRTLAFLFFALAVAGAISTINSQAPLKSVGYTIWVLFDFFIVVSAFYNFARLYEPDLVLSVWLLVFRLLAAMTLAELVRNVAFHLLRRPQLWFYEPSYLAVFLTGYYGAALYLTLSRGRKYAGDIVLSVLAMATLSSATAMFGVLFATILNILFTRQRLKLLLWSAVLIGLGIAAGYTFFGQTRYFDVVVGFLLRKDGISLLLERGGDRWLRVLIGWDAFLHHPLLGVGIGGDAAYMHTASYPQEVVRLSKPWTDVREGEPFCNIFVEILGTTGIVGFIPFISILGYAAWRMTGWFRKPPPVAVVFLIGFFSTLLALQFDGTVLRYYVWSSLGLGMGVLARAHAMPSAGAAHLADPPNRL